MKSYLELIDTQTSGNRNDITPVFRNFEAFQTLTNDICKRIQSCEFDLVAGIDALGFVLGTAVSLQMKKGFICIRKGGKLPIEVETVSFNDYTGKTKSLELGIDSIVPGSKILLVDEWIETGAQVRASAQLIEKQNGIVAAITAIAMEKNDNTKDLFEKYNCLPLTDGRIVDLLAELN